jgi:hypothetical protein
VGERIKSVSLDRRTWFSRRLLAETRKQPAEKRRIDLPTCGHCD